MEDPKAVIADAFARLKQSITEEDAHNFASTELEDVWTAVREIDSQQRKRQSAQNLRRIEPLLRGIENYAKVIEVLCNGTPFMPYAWAPIKLMLEIASRHRDVFEALLSAYADIGTALPRFDRYNEAFSKNLEFQNALAAVYVGILDFHQRAYKYFRRRAWHVLFLSFWKDFGSRFDNIVTSLKKQRDFIDIEAASFDIVESKQARIIMQDEIRRKQKQELELLEENEQNTMISQLQHAFAWISTDGKAQETQYERTLKRRHDGTCKWLTDEPYFKSWIKDDSRRPCLWLNGKPGSGKSVMCSHIIQTLTDTPGLTICYYFCNSQDTGNVCHEILMTMVLQVLRQHPDICSLVANNYVYQGLSSGMTQLRALLPQLLEVIGYFRVVVDGIDECPKESQKAILKEIQTVCTTPTTHCKVLFSSRKEVHIRQKLSGLPQISLDGRQEVDWDIRTFVKYKISKLQTSNQRLLEMVESLLVEKANGMFLWVRLVAHELKYCYSDTALEETATRLPQGLKAAYGRILNRIMDIDSKNAKYMALRILGWMSCAHRALKTYEILDGIAFDFSNTSLTSKAKISKEILDLCHPLIEEGPKNTVEFVHFSAKEYILEEEYQAARPFICRQKAHLDISFSCITLLSSCSQLLPLYSTLSRRATIIVQGFHGLLIYADAFWCKHLLEYCSFLGQERQSFSPELLAQLQLLLKFRKTVVEASNVSQSIELQLSDMEDCGLEALNHLPDIKQLVLDVLTFRAKMNKEHGTNNSSETPSLKSYDKDPTELGSIHYHYQSVVESLLDSKAIEKFHNLLECDLKTFRETYGPSGFLCRYLHCVSSTDGFDSSLERVKHESQHQRKFRCAYPACVFFRPGFVNRTMLNKHNEKYHPMIQIGLNLGQSIRNKLEGSKISRSARIEGNDSATFDGSKEFGESQKIKLQISDPNAQSQDQATNYDLMKSPVEKIETGPENETLKGVNVVANPSTGNKVPQVVIDLSEPDLEALLEAKPIRSRFIQQDHYQIQKGYSLNSVEKDQYSDIIDDILASSNLKTISAKQIRNALQEKLQHNISKKKNAIKNLILERYFLMETQQAVITAKNLELTQKLQARGENVERTILGLRHKFQEGLLTRDQEPKEEGIEVIAQHLTHLEEYADLESSIIRSTKINKVLKAILNLPHIPKEDVFHFKLRSQTLLDKWNKILASDISSPIHTQALQARLQQPEINHVSQRTSQKKHDEKNIERSRQLKEQGQRDKAPIVSYGYIDLIAEQDKYDAPRPARSNTDGEEAGIERGSLWRQISSELPETINLVSSDSDDDEELDSASIQNSFPPIPKDLSPSQGVSMATVLDSGNPPKLVKPKGEKPYTIKCICGYSNDDGNTIHCENCNKWQHIKCFYPDRVKEASRGDLDHFCDKCQPRTLNRESANNQQLLRRRLSNEAEKGNKKTERPPLQPHKKSLRPLTEAETSNKLYVLLRDMRLHVALNPSMGPLRSHSANSHHHFQLSEPMYLETISQKLMLGKYSTAEKFVRDATLMLENFRRSYGHEVPRTAAIGMEANMWERIKQVPEWSHLWHLEPQR